MSPGAATRRQAVERFLPRSPFATHLGLELAALEPDRAVLRLPFCPEHATLADVVHGGAIATLIDTAMGEAVATNAGDAMPVTVEIKVNYLEPGRPGVLVADAKVHKRGKRFTVVETEVVQEESGDLVAFATGTFTTVG